MKVLKIGASKVDDKTGALVTQVKDVSMGDDPDADAPSFENTMTACALGLTAFPYPATDEGYCEAVTAADGEVAGLDAVVIGARDLRTAKIVGNLKPGDTCLHSTGPQQAAQVQLKEDKRQAVMLSKDSRGKTMLLMLDGNSGKIQLSCYGNMLEMGPDGIKLSTGGATLTLKGDSASLVGSSVHCGGLTPNPLKPMLGPPTGSPGSTAAVPMVAAKGFTTSGVVLAIAACSWLAAQLI